MVIVFPGSLLFVFLAICLCLLGVREFIRDPIGTIVGGLIMIFLIFFIGERLEHPDLKVDQVATLAFNDIKDANWPWK